jgi:hypothetical protein
MEPVLTRGRHCFFTALQALGGACEVCDEIHASPADAMVRSQFLPAFEICRVLQMCLPLPPAPQDLEFSCEQVFFLPFAPLPSASGQQLLSAKA